MVTFANARGTGKPVPIGVPPASLPFGDGQTVTGACYHDSTLHFTGKERDSETGLDNFGARYNSSSFGRFLSPDWSASPSPVPYASLPYPQSLNLYAYVQNNPLKSTDPTGHCTVDGEDHGWLWCAAHFIRAVETKKEEAAREAETAKKEAEFQAWRQEQIKKTGVDPVAEMQAFMAFMGGTMGSLGPLAEPEPSGTPRATVNGVPQPDPNGEIVVAPDGTAIKIPAGYVRPAGSTGDANIIEIMGPDKMNPNGYAKVYNSIGQPIDPSTMKQGTTRAAQHIQFGKQP